MRLTIEQLGFYSENGYVIIPGLFSKEESASLLITTEMLVEHIKSIEFTGGENRFEDFHGSQVVLSTRPDSHGMAIKRIVWAAAACPSLLETGRDLRLLELISQILETSEADHLINQIHLKDPGDGVCFPWHQDEQNRRKFDPEWSDCGHNGSYVVAITAIDSCHFENGPLFVIPGSHKYGYLNFGAFLSTEALQTRIMHDKHILVSDVQRPLIMHPGDTVLMHPRLIDASWPNNGYESRRVLINAFTSHGANHRQYPGTCSAKRI